MKSARILILGLGFATALGACSSNTAQTTVLTTVQTPVQTQPASPSTQKVLGTIDLQAGDNGNMLSAKAITIAGKISVTLVSTGGYPLRQRFNDDFHQDYLTYKYAVKNNGDTPIRNLTFVALNRPQSAPGAPATVLGTPFISISGSSPYPGFDYLQEGVISFMDPSPGMKDNTPGSRYPFRVDPQTADFQLVPPIPGYPNALGYGFLAHGPTTGTGGVYERPNSRTIQPGQTGDVFITYHTPLFSEVTKFKLAMLVVTDSVDALTESEEDNYSLTISGFPISAFQSNLNVRMRHCLSSILNPQYPEFTTDYGRGDLMRYRLKRNSTDPYRTRYYCD
jgi:hypothetical protein